MSSAKRKASTKTTQSGQTAAGSKKNRKTNRTSLYVKYEDDYESSDSGSGYPPASNKGYRYRRYREYFQFLPWAVIGFVAIAMMWGNSQKQVTNKQNSVSPATSFVHQSKPQPYSAPFKRLSPLGAVREAQQQVLASTELLQSANFTLFGHFLSSALGVTCVTADPKRPVSEYGDWYRGAIKCELVPLYLVKRCPGPRTGALALTALDRKHYGAEAYALGVGDDTFEGQYGEDEKLSPTGAFLAERGYNMPCLTISGAPCKVKNPSFTRFAVNGSAVVAICGYLGAAYSLEGIDETGDLTGIVPASHIIQCLADHPEAWMQGCAAQTLYPPYPDCCHPLDAL